MLALLLCGPPLFARDFAERPRSVVLTDEDESAIRLLPGTWVDTAFTYQLWRTSPEDEFQLRNMLHMALAEVHGLIPSIYYGTFMLAGPVNPGERPGAEAAQWMMNAVQFEYGVLLQYRVHDWTLLAEYGRRSYHPLRDGFGEPTADILRGGFAPPAVSLGPLRLEGLVRVGWVELYDFWGTDIPEPPYNAALYSALELRGPRLAGGVEPFAVALWDALLLTGGGVQHDVVVEAGVGVQRGRDRLELYLEYYRSPDTEQREQRRSPAELFGYGVRLIVDVGGD